MADTEASIGYGITFEMADAATPTEFDYVAEIFNVTPPSDTTDQVDATHMQSPNRTREFIEGLTDPGEASFEMNYVVGSASDLLLLAAKGKRKWCRITFPNGVQVMFWGSRQGYEKSAPTDDKMTATVTFKVSGEPIQTPTAAPRVIVAPTIVGAAAPKVGVPLLADLGIVAGALDVAIQWRISDGSGLADITGATGMSYIPKAGDIGETIVLKTIPSNGAFQTPVESEPTEIVAAA